MNATDAPPEFGRDWSKMLVWYRGNHYYIGAIDGEHTVGPFDTNHEANVALRALQKRQPSPDSAVESEADDE